MISKLILLSFSLIASISYSQNFELTGVISNESSEPFDSVLVKIGNISFDTIYDSTYSDYSGEFTLQFKLIDTLTNINSYTINRELFVYQNPASSFNVTGQLEDYPLNNIVSIYNISGREIRQVELEYFPNGVINYYWNGTSVPDGLYIGVVHGQNRIHNQKFLKINAVPPSNPNSSNFNQIKSTVSIKSATSVEAGVTSFTVHLSAEEYEPVYDTITLIGNEPNVKDYFLQPTTKYFTLNFVNSLREGEFVVTDTASNQEVGRVVTNKDGAGHISFRTQGSEDNMNVSVYGLGAYQVTIDTIINLKEGLNTANLYKGSMFSFEGNVTEDVNLLAVDDNNPTDTLFGQSQTSVTYDIDNLVREADSILVRLTASKGDSATTEIYWAQRGNNFQDITVNTGNVEPTEDSALVYRRLHLGGNSIIGAKVTLQKAGSPEEIYEIVTGEFGIWRDTVAVADLGSDYIISFDFVPGQTNIIFKPLKKMVKLTKGENPQEQDEVEALPNPIIQGVVRDLFDTSIVLSNVLVEVYEYYTDTLIVSEITDINGYYQTTEMPLNTEYYFKVHGNDGYMNRSKHSVPFKMNGYEYVSDTLKTYNWLLIPHWKDGVYYSALEWKRYYHNTQLENAAGREILFYFEGFNPYQDSCINVYIDTLNAVFNANIKRVYYDKPPRESDLNSYNVYTNYYKDSIINRGFTNGNQTVSCQSSEPYGDGNIILSTCWFSASLDSRSSSMGKELGRALGFDQISIGMMAPDGGDIIPIDRLMGYHILLQGRLRFSNFYDSWNLDNLYTNLNPDFINLYIEALFPYYNISIEGLNVNYDIRTFKNYSTDFKVPIYNSEGEASELKITIESSLIPPSFETIIDTVTINPTYNAVEYTLPD